ncbi:MAG: hypothetical protein NC432_08515 [Roseburia sp.]|nr:hypothetical protein [Roseburia sp.]MCM1099068.1 hypothetical protein [Ruminococcus flavefaciens]
MDMDGLNISGMAGESFGLQDVPAGFGFALAMNEPAMRTYASLSETDKEHLLMRCRDAGSKAEMQKIVDSLVPDTDVDAVLKEESEKEKLM